MLRQTLKKIIKGQKGQALPIVLILLLIGGLLIVPTLNYASTSLKGHEVVESNTLEFYAADSGVEDALHWIIHGKETGGLWTWDKDTGYGERDTYYMNGKPVAVNGKPVAVNVTSMGSSIYKITSTATSVDGHTTVLSTVWAITCFEGGHEFNHQNPPPPGDIWVNGDATIAGNIEITGNFIASGNVTSMNNAKITGTVLIEGDLTLANNSEIHGTLCCSGDITLGNGCLIKGNIHVLGDHGTITLTESGAKIEGNIWADGNLTIDLAANVPIEGNIYAPGNIYEPTADIFIYLRKPNSKIVGDIYASGSIDTLVEIGEIIGEKYENHPDFLPAPECPDPPSNPTRVITWEIT